MKSLTQTLSLLLVSAMLGCAGSPTKKVGPSEMTGRNLPPELIQRLTQTQFCRMKFESSKYNQLISTDKTQKIPTEVMLNTPYQPGCSIGSNLRSIIFARRLQNQVLAELNSPKISTEQKKNLTIQVLQVQAKTFAEQPTSLGELILRVISIESWIEKAKKIKSPALQDTILKIANDLDQQKDQVLKNSFDSEVIIFQNTAYRMEIFDWSQTGLVSGPIELPTEAQLDFGSAQNKYAEIMELEKFKVLIHQNFDCLKAKTCEVENLKKENESANGVFVQLIKPNLSSAFARYYLAIDKIKNLAAQN